MLRKAIDGKQVIFDAKWSKCLFAVYHLRDYCYFFAALESWYGLPQIFNSSTVIARAQEELMWINQDPHPETMIRQRDRSTLLRCKPDWLETFQQCLIAYICRIAVSDGK